MKHLELLLYPELRALGERDRDRALRHARSLPFDLVELLGMAAAVVLVTAATRYGLRLDALEQFWMVIANFAVALPLLAVTVGPLLYRRTRRGLRRALQGQPARGGSA
jgi:hypothetical protein